MIWVVAYPKAGSPAFGWREFVREREAHAYAEVFGGMVLTQPEFQKRAGRYLCQQEVGNDRAPVGLADGA